MAASLQTAFVGLKLGAPVQRQQRSFTSNGTGMKVAMKGKHTFQVEVVVGNDEPQDSAMKRFRREVLQAGVVPEVRRRRYFENSVDMKKRKERESWKKLKRNKFPPRTYEQAMTQETSPFNDMFGTADDIFADVLSVGEGVSSSR